MVFCGPQGSDFYPRSPCGERHILCAVSVQIGGFLSTLSLRRATVSNQCKIDQKRNFYPRSPCGERRMILMQRFCVSIFLSTLSLRRATLAGPSGPAFLYNFYPRSPCGERLFLLRKITITVDISIHALLAESDFL